MDNHRDVESLEKAQSLMRATLESSIDGVLILNEFQKITHFNKNFIEMWKLPAGILENKDFKSFCEHIVTNCENGNEFIERLKKVEKKPDEVVAGVLRFQIGKVFNYYSQPYYVNEIMAGRVWNFRDTTKNVLLEEELQFQSSHDSLTGLPNRLLLLDRIKQAMAKADRHNHSFALFNLDIDRFKLVNDSTNHEAGDEILRAIANRISSVLRTEDTLARLGGDEFVILINEISQENDLINIANKVMGVFAEPFELYGNNLHLSASIGICIYPKDGRQIDILLRNTDTAMYRAKELGGNQFQFYTDELNQRNLQRLSVESELRHALTNGELFLNFQPQYDLKTAKLVSLEALLRWQHPVKGVILPNEFLPIAEESGLIVPIGEWVLRSACKQLKKWMDQGLPAVRMGINIAVKQFKIYNLTETIETILEETGLPSTCLELEIAEGVLAKNPDIIKNIKSIRSLGVQIALDNFGTGYTSLKLLKELPIDRLKIDKSYLMNYDAESGDDVIIQAIIAMAQTLNIDVVAEGVETEQQANFLKFMKCKEVQGYYFSKPLSVNDCERLLERSLKLEEKAFTE